MIPGSLQIRYWQLFSLSDHENRSHVEFWRCWQRSWILRITDPSCSAGEYVSDYFVCECFDPAIQVPVSFLPSRCVLAERGNLSLSPLWGKSIASWCHTMKSWFGPHCKAMQEFTFWLDKSRVGSCSLCNQRCDSIKHMQKHPDSEHIGQITNNWEQGCGDGEWS